MLPPEAAGMMQMLGPYPNFDEDDARLERDAVRTANAGTITAASGADSAVRATQQVYHGQSASALQRHWETTGVQGGHVAQANAALQTAPVALEAAASVVSAVKVAVGTQAVFASVEVARLLAFGGAAGTTAAIARMLMRRKIVGTTLHEGRKGTDNVIAPYLRRSLGDVMRRIQDDLRRLRGPGAPRPALAGAGGRNLPMRPAGLRPPSGPRSAQDGMAQMARGKKRSGGGSSGGGSRGGWRDDGIKFHGKVPKSTEGMTKEQAQELEQKLEASVEERTMQLKWYNDNDPGHVARVEQETQALGMIKRFLKGK
ncbi:hypothetical protein ACTMTI_33680 [Nonomuraea sp. H19]